MLLRSITKHVREQNWFAVALDFFIVVAGILIAFQITNWNEARSNAQAERALLERLHDEISEVQAGDAATRAIFIDDRQKNMVTARYVVLGLVDRAELTDGECLAIGFSHLALFAGRSNIPVLDELRATGESALIRNENIVREISQLTSLLEGARGFEESTRQKITLLSRAFPDLLSTGLKKDTVEFSDFEPDPYDLHYTCDAPGMRASAAFRNAFAENASQQFVLLEFAVDPLRQSMSDLHTMLDKALGETHEHK